MLSTISREAHCLCLYQISRQNLQCYLRYRKIIYSIQHSPSWETNSFSAMQEIPRVLWHKKVHFLVNINPLPVPILKQIIPFHALNSISWKYILILSSHFCLGLPSGLLPAFNYWNALSYKLENRDNFRTLYFTLLYILQNNNYKRNALLPNEVPLCIIIWGPQIV